MMGQNQSRNSLTNEGALCSGSRQLWSGSIPLMLMACGHMPKHIHHVTFMYTDADIQPPAKQTAVATAVKGHWQLATKVAARMDPH